MSRRRRLSLPRVEDQCCEERLNKGLSWPSLRNVAVERARPMFGLVEGSVGKESEFRRAQGEVKKGKLEDRLEAQLHEARICGASIEQRLA